MMHVVSPADVVPDAVPISLMHRLIVAVGRFCRKPRRSVITAMAVTADRPWCRLHVQRDDLRGAGLVCKNRWWLRIRAGRGHPPVPSNMVDARDRPARSGLAGQRRERR